MYPQSLCYYFFFSSRRRHTRPLCDWSSDVCSSDLLTAQDLPRLGQGQFYECWYAGQNSRSGHLELITAGTFVGNGTVHMWSAADPARFKVMQITIEQAGDASQHGRVILSGVAQS